MKTMLHVACVAAVALLPAKGMVYAQVPLSTEFTYQGELKQAGVPVDGLADFEFSLWDAGNGGNQVGPNAWVREVDVVDGLFTVQIDFGSDVFDGEARWLQITVTYPSGSGTPTTLSPRQPLTAMPYALQARGLFVTSDLMVGIGTTSPASMLDVESTENVHGIRATVPYIAVRAHRASTTGTWPAIHGECDSESTDGSAVRGVMTSTTPGSGSAAVRGINNGTGGAGIGVYGSHAGSGWGVHGTCPDGRGVYGYSANAYGGYFTGAENTGSVAALAVQSGTQVMRLDGNEIDSNGALYLNNNSTNDVYIANGGGNVIVPVLQITGADVAEKFPVSEEVKPGMVVAIDRDHPGQLCLARGAYNRCVAGVVSGANGLSAGAVLGNMPGQESSPAVALGGRVWVLCDATGQPIEPGDLLTTSDAPGHAMKVSDYTRAQGAIIGKAMTSLDSGRGLVLVLVGLH